MAEPFVRLTKAHVRDGFRSGKPSLDDFLRAYALQNERTGTSRTFVAHTDRVVAYYSLSASLIAFEHAPPVLVRRSPRYPIPAVRLARLAVDQRDQGRGLGAAALMDAYVRVLRLSDDLGIRVLEIDALDDDAVRFYERHGATAFLDSPRHLFVTVEHLRAAREEAG